MLQRRDPVWVIIPLGVALALSLAGDSTLYASLPSQPATTGITVGMLGWILGINRAVRIVLNPLAGLLYDPGRRRPLFILGMSLGTLSTTLYALVDGFWPLFAARIIWGTAWALLLVGGYTIVLDVTTPANRGRFTGLFQAWYFLGGAFGMITGGVLTDQIGYRPTLWVCTALTGFGTLVAAATLPETNNHARSLRDLRLRLPQLQVAQLAGIDRRILAADYVNLVYYFVGNGVLVSTLGLALSRWAGPETRIGPSSVASLTGLLLASRAVLSVIVAPAAGTLSDWRRDRWLVVGLGMLVLLAGFGVLAGDNRLRALVAGVVLVALGGGILMPALTALMGDLAPAGRQGVAMGSFATAADIGSAAGPILAYTLVTSLALKWVYGLCAGLVLTALAVLWGVRVTEERIPGSASIEPDG
ncbi:MAG: MFS transporter [Anaerolineae bacterium]